MFDLSKVENPLMTSYKFIKNDLCTRIKKINEYEFIVLLFPKRVTFFKIIEEEIFQKNQ